MRFLWTPKADILLRDSFEWSIFLAFVILSECIIWKTFVVIMYSLLQYSSLCGIKAGVLAVLHNIKGWQCVEKGAGCYTQDNVVGDRGLIRMMDLNNEVSSVDHLWGCNCINVWHFHIRHDSWLKLLYMFWSHLFHLWAIFNTRKLLDHATDPSNI